VRFIPWFSFYPLAPLKADDHLSTQAVSTKHQTARHGSADEHTCLHVPQQICGSKTFPSFTDCFHLFFKNSSDLALASSTTHALSRNPSRTMVASISAWSKETRKPSAHPAEGLRIVIHHASLRVIFHDSLTLFAISRFFLHGIFKGTPSFQNKTHSTVSVWCLPALVQCLG
jgi:hypothetical protein